MNESKVQRIIEFTCIVITSILIGKKFGYEIGVSLGLVLYIHLPVIK